MLLQCFNTTSVNPQPALIIIIFSFATSTAYLDVSSHVFVQSSFIRYTYIYLKEERTRHSRSRSPFSVLGVCRPICGALFTHVGPLFFAADMQNPIAGSYITMMPLSLLLLASSSLLLLGAFFIQLYGDYTFVLILLLLCRQ